MKDGFLKQILYLTKYLLPHKRVLAISLSLSMIGITLGMIQPLFAKVLIDEVRYDVARQLLRDTALPVAEIAAALDYSGSAVFDRAFRRWSGMSPSAWRDEHAIV